MFGGNIMNLHRQLLLIPALLFGLGSASAAHANKAFAEAYYENFRDGSLTLQTKTCEKISDYSGITDERIFDLIEDKLVKISAQEKISGEEKKAAVCFARALATSGNTKYRQSLVSIGKNSSHRAVRKAAEEAEPQIEKFQRWNRVINSNDHEMQGRSDHLALWMRLIDSNQADMGIYALEQAETFNNHDINMLVLLEEKLQDAVSQSSFSDEQLDFYAKTMNFLMAHPEFGKYTSLINEVAEKAKNKKLAKLARRALSV